MPENENETTNSYPPRKWIAPAIFLGIVLLVLANMSGSSGDTAPEPEPAAPSFGEGDAILNCEDAVKRQLANPATANFSILDTEATQHGPGWDVVGTVTAESDFGVEQEVAFDCYVEEGKPVEAQVSQP